MRRRQRGQSLVEFALVFPLIVAALAGSIDLGLIVWTKSMLAGAAHQGARYAVVNGSKGDCPLDATGTPTGASLPTCDPLADVVQKYLAGVTGDVAIELCYGVGCSPRKIWSSGSPCPGTLLPPSATAALPGPVQNLPVTVVATAANRPFFLGLFSGLDPSFACFQNTESSTMVVQH